MTMTLIETKTLGTAAASIEFTSIPQTFTDLVLLVSVRLDVDAIELNIRFNGDTGSNFSRRRLIGSTLFTPFSDVFTGSSILTSAAGFSVSTSNTFGNASVYIPNYSGSTAKSVSVDSVNENNSSIAFQEIDAGLWTGTAGITSILLGRFNGGNLVAGSTISLYGILKGSDGIVTTS